ncbi:MAG: hypothetical protein HC895_02210 [Leptolyngbyaceae cyanobacterium SM1_3_5]|nr:hypothetical protein [Leptolyngbyaceae cyanobacterium SM1_3_5]
MAEEYIWIVTDEPIVPVPSIDGARDGGISRGAFDDPVVELPIRRGVPVNAAKLEQGMTDFLQVVGRVLNHVQNRSQELAGMELDEIELSVEINGEGQVSLLGTGGKMGGSSGMTLKFKRSQPQ